MEINGNNRLLPPDATFQRLDPQPQVQRLNKASEEEARPEADRIELSVRSREIQRMDEWIRSTPDIREARVEQIRRAVDNGTYNVKAEMIAEKIIGGSVIDEVF
jgi:negative regulator of flagellin synthesis FlgM